MWCTPLNIVIFLDQSYFDDPTHRRRSGRPRAIQSRPSSIPRPLPLMRDVTLATYAG